MTKSLTGVIISVTYTSEHLSREIALICLFEMDPTKYPSSSKIGNPFKRNNTTINSNVKYDVYTNALSMINVLLARSV